MYIRKLQKYFLTFRRLENMMFTCVELSYVWYKLRYKIMRIPCIIYLYLVYVYD